MMHRSRERTRFEKAILNASGLLIAASLLTVGTTALAEPGQTKSGKQGFSMAAADPAGWVVFPGHRTGRAEDLAPSAVKLSRITRPGQATTPALDWLNRWGGVQTRMAR